MNAQDMVLHGDFVEEVYMKVPLGLIYFFPTLNK